MPIVDIARLWDNSTLQLIAEHYSRKEGEMSKIHFIIFKSQNDTQYIITESNRSGVKQAFLSEGHVSGDWTVLLRLSQMKPDNESIERYLEKNAENLIYGGC